MKISHLGARAGAGVQGFACPLSKLNSTSSLNFFSSTSRRSFSSKSFSSPFSKKLKKLPYAVAGVGMLVGGSVLVNDPARSEEKKNRVYSWGSGQYGQLGHGDENSQQRPTHIASLSGVVQASTGDESSAVLTDDGRIYTFGRGQSFCLGHGDDSGVPLPKLVDSLADKKIKYVTTSGHLSAAIDDQGRLYTWGRSAVGRPGNNRLPAVVEGLSKLGVKDVACGRGHSLAVTKNGELYAWGQGKDGALGLGDKLDKDIPTLVFPLKDVKVKQVSCGSGFSLILSETGELYACGTADYGQTGLGSTSELSVRSPTKIRSLREKKVVQVSAGDYHCACVTEDGEVYVWGLGSDGQIGNGTTKLHNITPTLVEGLKGKKIVAVACGGAHTGAIDQNGNLYMWGKGRDGQLGRGDQLESVAAYRAEPVLVPFFKDIQVKEVTLGKDFTVALA